MRESISPLRIVFILTLLLAFCAGGFLAVAENTRVENMRNSQMFAPVAAGQRNNIERL